MSRWLPIHVRRIIAILLLLLDLGLEPGSALAFVGMANPEENEAVADLCRQDDFWWGKTSAAIDESAHVVQTSADCGDGTQSETATQVGSAGSVIHVAIAFNADIGITAADRSFALALREHALPAFNRHSVHRNSYIAQKREIVLIV